MADRVSRKIDLSSAEFVGRSVLAVALLVGLIAASGPVKAFPVRIDPPSPDYLVGNLTWSGTSGGISWSGTTGANDLVDPNPSYPNPAASTGFGPLYWPFYSNNVYGNCYRYLDGSYGLSAQGVPGSPCNLPRTLEFQSQPLPAAVKLNVSRLVQVRMLLKEENSSATGYICSSGRASFEIELSLSGKMIAGGTPITKWAGTDDFTNFPIYWKSSEIPVNNVPGNYKGPPYDATPSVPMGFCQMTAALQSEVASLEKSDILTVKLRLLNQDRPFQIGVGPGHQSVIAIPVYSADETTFRLVEAPYSPETPSSGAGTGFALPLGVGCAIWRRGKASHLALLSTLLVLLPLLAGCTQMSSSSVSDSMKESDAQVRGDLNQVFVPGGGQGPTNGSVLGRVFDEYRRPLIGARATVIRGDFADVATVDSRGQFRFALLAAGQYTFRVDREGYKSFISALPIVVKANATTYVEVGLEPLAVLTSERGLHTHEFWGGKTSKTLMKDVSVRGGPSIVSPFSIPALGGNDYGSILPGTASIDLTVTWTGDPTKVALAFKSPLDVTPFDSSSVTPNGIGNYSLLFPRTSGSVFHIPTNWEMTEPGHQRFSSWQFQIIPYDYQQTSAQGANSPLGTASPFPATYTVSLEIHRGGRLPLEPGHVDLWGGNASRLVASRTFLNVACQSISGFCKGVVAQGGRNLSLLPSERIPSETTWIDVVATQSRPTPAEPIQWTLLYKGAASAAAGCPTQYGPNRIEQNVAKKIQGAPGEGTHRWRIEPKEGEPDPFYAKQSNWCFWLYDGREQIFYSADAATNGNPSLAVVITAHRDAIPA